MSNRFWKIAQTYSDFIYFFSPNVDEACIEPFHEGDIKLESDLNNPPLAVVKVFW